MPPCDSCPKVFHGNNAYLQLEKHQRNTGHCYCPLCDKHFKTKEITKKHRPVAHNLPCGECWRRFVDQASLQEHKGRNDRDLYCEVCDHIFNAITHFRDHQNSSRHINLRKQLLSQKMAFYCCDCHKDFADETIFRQHLDCKHYKSLSKPYCEKCERFFVNQEALDQHLASLVHCSPSNIPCVASENCKKRFKIPSALANHLESGACKSGMSKNELHRLVHAADTDHSITTRSMKKSMEILNSDGSSSMSSGSIIYTPTTSEIDEESCDELSNSWTILLPRPTDSSMENQEPLDTLAALTGHVASHVTSLSHDLVTFHCPLSLFSNPDEDIEKHSKRTFSTLGGLMQHIESGACKSGRRMLWKVAQIVETSLGVMGLRHMNLLLNEGDADA
ncbi:MAG: hypothetical protein M1834_000757 [Cirrosporium novae-zelandiae]|nr:MAG: hypothetical protein M1834_000757 [Cirrosporium novae-zelandiae]